MTFVERSRVLQSTERPIPSALSSTNTNFLENMREDSQANKILYLCRSITSYTCTLHVSKSPMSGNIAEHRLYERSVGVWRLPGLINSRSDHFRAYELEGLVY